MNVILIKELKNKGNVGDPITVSRGYAMNYLIPKGFAIPENQASTQQFKELKAKETLRLAEEKQHATTLLKTVNGAKVTITAKTNDDKLYGSVPPNTIAKALNSELNSSLSKDQIILETPIRSTGEHQVTVQLHPEVLAKITLTVNPETVEDLDNTTDESAEEASE